MSNSGSAFDAESQSEASASASESSDLEKSSTFSRDRSKSRGRPRKRTPTEGLPSSHSKSKQLKSFYNDDYRTLFNSTINELMSDRPSKADHLLPESQVGATIWSSEEKKAFFSALASRGRHDIRGIATEIGTKSESEVKVYLRKLCKAAVNQQVHRARKDLLDTSSLEAALELQGDCCAALDLTAETLSALQQNEEERAEKKKHKELAFLTPRIARWIQRCIVVPTIDEEEVIRRIPAATLLNLINFLALSKRFFMNSVIAEDNWRSYTGRRARSPSIMYTAFSDFYALVISITQRLVHSSMYFAMSRLRAVSASGRHTPGSFVRRRDIKAAIHVLGMRADSKVFWAKVARRCRLRVYEKVRHRQVFGKRYTYMELEQLLSTSMTKEPNRPETETKGASTSLLRRGRTLTGLSARALEDSVSSDSLSVDGSDSKASSNDELSATTLHSKQNENLKHEDHDGLQDAYAEALDQHAGLNEERHLWEMLDEDPTERMESSDANLPKRPLPDRQDDSELFDWKDSVDYAEEWETHEHRVFGSSPSDGGPFQMDVDLAAGLTSSGPSSGGSFIDVATETEHGSNSHKDADSDDATNNDSVHAMSAEGERD